MFIYIFKECNLDLSLSSARLTTTKGRTNNGKIENLIAKLIIAHKY